MLSEIGKKGGYLANLTRSKTAFALYFRAEVVSINSSIFIVTMDRYQHEAQLEEKSIEWSQLR